MNEPTGSPPQSSEKTMIARRATKYIAIGLGLYIGSYIVLSSCGHEMNRLVVSGRVRFIAGFGSPDTVVWQPALLDVGYRRGRGLSRLYSPLIHLDHRLWHKERWIFD